MVLAVLLFMGSQDACSQKNIIKFEHFNIEQGLPSGVVPCLFQDRKGFIWFGTFHGIARYDGYKIVPYTNREGDTTSISNAVIEAICDDNEGNIWVGHARGLDKFNTVTETFTHFVLNSRKPLTDWSQHVLCLHVDKDGILWIGTGGGLYKFNKATNSFLWLKHSNTDSQSIISNSVNAIYEDRNGSLWFGTGSGLDMFDKSTNKFKHYWAEPNEQLDHALMKGNVHWVLSVYEDSEGIMWLGTNGGLVMFDRRNEAFIIYSHNASNPSSLANNTISSLCEDAGGKLWLSTKSGVDVFEKNSKIFMHYSQNVKEPESLSSDNVAQILMDRSGTIWISTYDHGGVNKYVPPNPAIRHYEFDGNKPGNFLNSGLSGIFEDSKGIIWFATPKGFVTFDPASEVLENEAYDPYLGLLSKSKDGTIWLYKLSGAIFFKKVNSDQFRQLFGFDGNAIILDKAVCMQNTSDGCIWFGTFDGDIYKINPVSGKISLLARISSRIEQIYEDKSGIVWIGTREGGIWCYDSRHETFKPFTYDLNDTLTISGNDVDWICEDKLGTLWIIADGRVNKFDHVRQKWIRLGKNEGFPTHIFMITSDRNGYLWMSAPDATYKYNPETNKFKKYDYLTGLSFKTTNGEMYLMNRKRITRFYPDSLRDNSFIPPVVITSFSKFEKPFPIGNGIRLPYDENFIAFEFAALSYIDPERNQYAYKLEGIDKAWVYSGTRRFASYPNLHPGKYIFRVKGSNNDGVWNEIGTSVSLIIFPPWWKTWWAYFSYGLFFLFALYSLRRYEMNRLSFRDQVKMDAAVLKEKEETEKLKSRFFANISHEFRTPLTLILGPAEKIISGTSDDNIKDANTIKRNSRRLLQLINQLLDLSKLEAGKLKLEASKGNIVSFVKGVALSFESLSESKDITLRLQTDKEYIELYFDREKMMQVLTNILSNAFKFTPVDGKITVSVKETDKKQVEIKVHDTGIGIATEEIPKLFDRFYQVDSSLTREFEGTGIGLALTKELVELHHGSIRVESKKEDIGSEGSGWTEFIVGLPMGKDHLKDEEILKDAVKVIETRVFANDENQLILNLPSFDSEIIREVLPGELQEERTIILVVEDNYDMREYIKESLDTNYQIEEAVNGEQGVRKAGKIIPDLIISDMMMPKMDGNELVRILKNDETTSHIPIILLTAKAGHDDKLEGLETGADDYLTKPFDIKELQVRVRNLISTKKKLQEKYSKPENLLQGTKEQRLSSIDEKFMFRVAQVIDKHISEEEFDIEEFCGEVAMSRTQLHRKLKALTGKSASLYIRSVKLARAKKMIEEKQATISEIAYSVGFSSPVYFTKCFREEYGYTPSDLKK